MAEKVCRNRDKKNHNSTLLVALIDGASSFLNSSFHFNDDGVDDS